MITELRKDQKRLFESKCSKLGDLLDKFFRRPADFTSRKLRDGIFYDYETGHTFQFTHRGIEYLIVVNGRRAEE